MFDYFFYCRLELRQVIDFLALNQEAAESQEEKISIIVLSSSFDQHDQTKNVLAGSFSEVQLAQIGRQKGQTPSFLQAVHNEDRQSDDAAHEDERVPGRHQPPFVSSHHHDRDVDHDRNHCKPRGLETESKTSRRRLQVVVQDDRAKNSQDPQLIEEVFRFLVRETYWNRQIEIERQANLDESFDHACSPCNKGGKD